MTLPFDVAVDGSVHHIHGEQVDNQQHDGQNLFSVNQEFNDPGHSCPVGPHERDSTKEGSQSYRQKEKQNVILMNSSRCIASRYTIATNTLRNTN